MGHGAVERLADGSCENQPLLQPDVGDGKQVANHEEMAVEHAMAPRETVLCDVHQPRSCVWRHRNA